MFGQPLHLWVVSVLLPGVPPVTAQISDLAGQCQRTSSEEGCVRHGPQHAALFQAAHRLTQETKPQRGRQAPEDFLAQAEAEAGVDMDLNFTNSSNGSEVNSSHSHLNASSYDPNVSSHSHLNASSYDPNVSSDPTYEPEHVSCQPTCTWECESPECDRQCQPVCQQPSCETRCSEANTTGCAMVCDQPQCYTVCPKRATCDSDDCGPMCTTHCSNPVCRLVCPQNQNCRSVCATPHCEYSCSIPSNCPAPRCHMQCEEPDSRCRGGSMSEEPPPLEPGELKVHDFEAPINLQHMHPAEQVLAQAETQASALKPESLPKEMMVLVITREPDSKYMVSMPVLDVHRPSDSST